MGHYPVKNAQFTIFSSNSPSEVHRCHGNRMEARTSDGRCWSWSRPFGVICNSFTYKPHHKH